LFEKSKYTKLANLQREDSMLPLRLLFESERVYAVLVLETFLTIVGIYCWIDQVISGHQEK
jgi:hypothetical protein